MAESSAASGGLQDVLSASRMKDRSNMVRVFISSTFTDMSSERKVLLDRAYPEVLTFCRSLGLVFEVVDLCWGLRSVPCGEHEEREVFQEEIRRCQQISAGPAFIALLGNRYGHRALPSLIQEKVFVSLLSMLSNDPEDARELNRWYLKDNNAVPPTYVLQPITAHFPHYGDLRGESSVQREKAAICWRAKEARLLQILRTAAAAAETAGDITPDQRREFSTSGLEQDFDLGLWGDSGAALVFIREVPRHRGRAAAKCLNKFLDLTADGLMDGDTQQFLAGLKSRLYVSCQEGISPHCVEVIHGGVDSQCGDHGHYLDAVCQQFVSQMKARITAVLDSAGTKTGKRVQDRDQEVALAHAFHCSTSTTLHAGLCGRVGLLGRLCLAIWESTGEDHGPLVVHGATGMGKTALLCGLAQEMQAVLEARGAVVVLRLLGACHPHRPDVVGLLRSLLLQICHAHSLAPPSGAKASSAPELSELLRTVLAEVSQRGDTLLLILDALDQLSDLHHAHELHWLPTRLPPHVHLVVSVDTNSKAFGSVRLKVEAVHRFFEVEPLARVDGQQIMESYLRAEGRRLTAGQAHGVLRLFEPTGSPLHLQLMLVEARCWTSFTPRAEARLGASTAAMLTQLLVRLEEAHGQEVVGGALGYIALAREGLLEAELRDVMSLDDDVIAEVYRHFLPPSPSLIRLPPLLWARLRRDLGALLEERWTEGVASLAFTHRCVWEAVAARYLTPACQRRRLRHLAEYFLGRWAGKLKPTVLPGLSLLLSDRKVPPQPLWFAPGVANVRKLQELPKHLLQAGLWEELRQEVIANAEWLYCKVRVCGVSSVIQDLDQCSQDMDCTETRLIRDTLVWMRPGTDFLSGQMDASLFYMELLARLCSLATPFPSLIGQLCSQCEDGLLACPEPVLVPKCSFLQQPGGALQHTLTGLCGGVVCVEVSVEADLLVAGSDHGRMAVWNLADRQLIHLLLGHRGAIRDIKVMDGSTHCLSLADDCSLRRWSLVSGQQLLCIHNVLDSAPCSAHLHLFEQKRLLFVCSSTQVKLWDLDQAKAVSSCVDEASVILGVLGESVVSLVGSSRVRMFNPFGGGQTEAVLDGHLSPGLFVLLQRHQKVLLVSEDGVLHQISSTSRRVFTLSLVPSLLTVTGDEHILITGHDGTLTLFRISDNCMEQILVLHQEDTVVSICVSSDCRLIVSGTADQMIHVWSVTSGALLDTLSSELPVSRLVFFKDFLLSASAAASCIHLWSLHYDVRHKPADHAPSGSAHVAIGRDAGEVFYVRHEKQTEVLGWSELKGGVSQRFQLSAEATCLEFLQDKRLLLCGLTSGTVLIYPLALPQETLCIPPPESLCRVVCLAASPQEKHLAVAYEDCVRLFQIMSRDSIPTVEGPLQVFPLPLLQAPLSSMALLSDRRLLYGTVCGQVALVDLQAGSSSRLEPHSSRITCVTASNWESHALVGSEDAVQRLWSLKPLLLDHTMEFKGLCFDGVLSAAFSESDRFVFTGSQDRTIKVWDVASGKLLLLQYVYSPIVCMVAFRNGFVALSQRGALVREAFHCPDHISPDYNPLRTVQAQYRVTSREQNQHHRQNHGTNLQGFNPAQFDLNLASMLTTKPSSSCTCL